ncbi:4-aminobutyrate--2-oxoglutarate transaminase [Variovorax sp. NFACC27]|uniref:4-aminobutyrate--2-oxoglutarate transaminase n=1 Tax=unclassified Variovorax TaxID=663243 RepID=UPI000896DC5A|nr:4-aminobutyrate aminotransferase / (S)-3-amino-2-methylpropionate transaminase [Variovorax sp. NFACC28]SEG93957.1 4-aminobutyrate aminotransferase / (S)-3-amino-2-methylpropionate transaminase [Variovorax sp. NFACC29]SFD58558.1 4-aminobutyrate aminotransferase / (S)-3-amino-2-methylpropionate transaminase [Variovorax sp. NFACC26]SFG88947.1 4-aminobutyrate aminotransferase / (S)-3-amino-2-methylpropionate transaminase [Variovorax sp. NFACC27]
MQREPHLSNAVLMARRSAAVARGVGQAHEIFVSRAANAELWDVEGRRYIDFAGGIAVLNTGHCHPEITAAVKAQADLYSHTCFQVVAYEPYVELAERLNALAPGAFAKKSVFLSTGAEAVENAVKIARAHTRRPGVIAFTGGYHGRTMMTLGLTGKVAPYKVGFGPFPGEVFHALYPNALHGVSVDDALHSVELLFKNDIEPERVAAFILEPVQGEGGFYVAPNDFVEGLRALADRHGILIIADEVQTGAGRTGTWFASEQWPVAPDLITTAKSMAGGFPISGVVGRAEVMDAPAPGGLGGTYAGSPIGCAAALAVLKVFDDEQLLARSRALGERLTAGLRRIAADVPAIGDVRGLGAMVAIELFEEGDTARPDAALTRKVVAEAARRGLILLSCGTYGNVIRVLVPLTASDLLVDEGLALLADSFAALR